MTSSVVVAVTAAGVGILAVTAVRVWLAASGAVARLPAGAARRHPADPVTAAVARWVAPLQLPWPAELSARVGVAALAVAAAGGMAVGGPLPALLTVAAAVSAPAVARSVVGVRRLRALDRHLPAALDGMARSLRSGASLRQAVAEAAAGAPGLLGDDLAEVAAAARLGTPLAAALDAWAARRPRPGVRLAVTALALAADTGGASARTIDGVAATLRERLAVDREVAAQAAQARLSAVVIGLAPLAFTVVAAATDPRTAAFLFRTPVGVACLAAGLGLDAAGGWWMHRLTRGRS